MAFNPLVNIYEQTLQRLALAGGNLIEDEPDIPSGVYTYPPSSATPAGTPSDGETWPEVDANGNLEQVWTWRDTFGWVSLHEYFASAQLATTNYSTETGTFEVSALVQIPDTPSNCLITRIGTSIVANDSSGAGEYRIMRIKEYYVNDSNGSVEQQYLANEAQFTMTMGFPERIWIPVESRPESNHLAYQLEITVGAGSSDDFFWTGQIHVGYRRRLGFSKPSI